MVLCLFLEFFSIFLSPEEGILLSAYPVLWKTFHAKYGRMPSRIDSSPTYVCLFKVKEQKFAIFIIFLNAYTNIILKYF